MSAAKHLSKNALGLQLSSNPKISENVTRKPKHS